MISTSVQNSLAADFSAVLQGSAPHSEAVVALAKVAEFYQQQWHHHERIATEAREKYETTQKILDDLTRLGGAAPSEASPKPDAAARPKQTPKAPATSKSEAKTTSATGTPAAKSAPAAKSTPATKPDTKTQPKTDAKSSPSKAASSKSKTQKTNTQKSSTTKHVQTANVPPHPLLEQQSLTQVILGRLKEVGKPQTSDDILRWLHGDSLKPSERSTARRSIQNVLAKGSPKYWQKVKPGQYQYDPSKAKR